MGGVVKGPAKLFGFNERLEATNMRQPEPKPAPQAQSPGVTQATQQQEKEGSRVRGARRRGRQLLSDARLAGEMGGETLGGGTNL